MIVRMGVTASRTKTCCSTNEKSGRTKRPPLNAANGVARLSGSTNICIPRGGRPLVIANATPAWRSLIVTAGWHACLRHLSCAVFVNFQLVKSAHPSAGEVEDRHVEHKHGIVISPGPRPDFA